MVPPMYDVLAQACRQLQPALLVMDGNPTLHECFLSTVHMEGDRCVLILDPVAGNPGEARRATVDFRVFGQELMVVGRPSFQHGRCELRVLRGPDARHHRSRRLMPLAESAVCSFVAPGGEHLRTYLPLLDIGAVALSVESSVPLPVEAVLRDLNVIFRNHVVRQAEGVVVHCVALQRVCGRPAFRCGVRLRHPSELPLPPPRSEEWAYITQRQQVLDVMWAVADLGAEATLFIGGQALHLRLLPMTGDRSTVQDLKACPLEEPEVPEGMGKLAVNLCGAGYKFTVRVRRGPEGTVLLRPSARMQLFIKRLDERWEPRPGERACVLPTP